MKKYLIVKFGSLGDILLITPVLQALKDDSECEIHFLVGKNCKSIIENNCYIDKLIEVDIASSKFNQILSLIKLIFVFAFKKYDCIFIYHRDTKILKFFKMISPSKIFIWADRDKKKKNIYEVQFDLKKHRIERAFDLIKASGLSITNYNKYNISYNIKNNCINPLSKFENCNKYIILSVGGGNNIWSQMPNRLWPISHYIELITKIRSTFSNYTIVLLGSIDDKSIIDKIEERCSYIINLAGKTTIDQTALAIRNSSLFIGNDSMPIFLACAFDIPIIGLFGPTDSRVIIPKRDNVFAIQSKAHCSPCYIPHDGLSGMAYTCKSNMCMKEYLSIQDVLNLVIKILGK